MRKYQLCKSFNKCRTTKSAPREYKWEYEEMPCCLAMPVISWYTIVPTSTSVFSLGPLRLRWMAGLSQSRAGAQLQHDYLYSTIFRRPHSRQDAHVPQNIEHWLSCAGPNCTCTLDWKAWSHKTSLTLRKCPKSEQQILSSSAVFTSELSTCIAECWVRIDYSHTTTVTDWRVGPKYSVPPAHTPSPCVYGLELSAQA